MKVLFVDYDYPWGYVYARCTPLTTYSRVSELPYNGECQGHDAPSGRVSHDYLGKMGLCQEYFGMMGLSYPCAVEWSPEINEQNASLSLDEECWVESVTSLSSEEYDKWEKITDEEYNQ